MLEYLAIIAGSWPIAVMVIGIGTAITIRRSLKQAMDIERAQKIDRAQGNQAVVVRNRSAEG